MEKGFTLFTALVAFILIVLSMLLVQSMISKERSTSGIISDISDQQEMQAIADLSRADSLQVFNFGIRYTIEDFSTKDTNPQDDLPDNTYYMRPEISGNWNGLQADFVKDRFGVSPDKGTKDQFATLAARHLISLLQGTDDVHGFEIELDNPDEAEMARNLGENFNKQSEKKDFFDLVGCEDGDYGNCIGSFYVTIDLSNEAMSEKDYESFPQVVVTNSFTGRTLKEPILPRGKFRIYVPVRLFKAIAGAKAVACNDCGGIYSPEFAGQMKGVFDSSKSKAQVEAQVSAAVRAIISDKGLAYNDSGKFGLYRQKPFTVLVSTAPCGNDCEKLGSYEVILYFEDTDDKYMVSKLQPNVYGMRLVYVYD